MNNKHFLTALGLLFACALSACQGEISPNVTETPCVPQTIEVTRIVQQPATTETAVPSLSITVQEGSTSVQLDPAYFDGVIVLTKYYTLLDHGLYEEVLPLYSSSLLKKTGGKNFEADLKSVKVISIYPYNYWLAKTGQLPQSIPENEIRYIVDTVVFHKAPAWNVGGTPQPDNRTRYISLVLEDGTWKLNEFQSSPWFP